MANNKIPAYVLQAYLSQQPPDYEVNLSTLATELADRSMQEALDFFSTLQEHQKVMYIFYLHNYYFNILTGNWLLEVNADDQNLQDLEDNFICKFNLDTTTLVGLRRLISRLQKEVAKQRQHRKEGVESES